MKVKVGLTANGWPMVEWDQERPRESKRDRWYRQSRHVAYGFAAIGAVIGGASGGGGGALAGGIVGFLIALWAAGAAARENVDMANLAKQALYTKERMSARVFVSTEHSYVLEFKNHTTGDLGQYPLERVKSFTLGTYKEWFGDSGGNDYPDYHVIVADDGTGRVVPLASHGKGRADMARLHAALTEQFITRRPEYMKPLPPAPAAGAEPPLEPETRPAPDDEKPERL